MHKSMFTGWHFDLMFTVNHDGDQFCAAIVDTDLDALSTFSQRRKNCHRANHRQTAQARYQCAHGDSEVQAET